MDVREFSAGEDQPEHVVDAGDDVNFRGVAIGALLRPKKNTLLDVRWVLAPLFPLGRASGHGENQ
jgi:hypothetical protein